jgi:hypothetical protein
MGMYNNILDKIKLPCCGKEVTDWQSKKIYITSKLGKLHPIENLLENIALEEIVQGEVHNACRKDEKFWEYPVKNGKLGKPVPRSILRDVTREEGAA